jgi:mono/diheme cytochrome c family protein
MTANIITVLAVVAGIVWLGLVVVSALRNRGTEEIAPNLQPGTNDQQMETRRLETGQKVAIAASAFLAISLPLYFLSEQTRQEGFVEEFEEASIERGEHLVEEFACYSCHGPLGVGGSATFVEKRSGVTVSWAAPAINDVFYRYDADEVNYWLTFGRGNTPMPAWGLAGGGPMNEKQIEDVVNYLRTIQVDQQEAVDAVAAEVDVQLGRLANADTTIETAIINQRQTVAELEQAPQDAEFIVPLADRADEILENADQGIDTDDDGLSDTAELELSEISVEARQHYQVIEPVQLDPATADAELLDQGLADLRAAAENDPILLLNIAAIEEILEGPAEGEEADPTDTDGDGITDQAEASISGQFVEASNATVPDRLSVISLDPTNPESMGGQPDLATATAMVGGLDTLRINTGVAAENQSRLLETERAGLEFLRNAAERRAWEIDIAGVAEAMQVSEEEAERAVGLFQANCARCHTAGFSAGIPFTQEAGSGGFGPALWDGRPVVQFGEDPVEGGDDLLVDFLINGSVANAPYGLNGFGSGRMPAFGTVLPLEDLELLAAYLRSGNLDGKGEAIEDVLP